MTVNKDSRLMSLHAPSECGRNYQVCFLVVSFVLKLNTAS